MPHSGINQNYAVGDTRILRVIHGRDARVTLFKAAHSSTLVHAVKHDR